MANPTVSEHILAAVGVVVVTYNSASTIVETLAALPLGETAAVVVVDNGSTDGTADLVRDARLEGVRIVVEPNRGFAAGCNTGASQLPPTRWVLFLNPDALVFRDAVVALAAYLHDQGDAAMAGPSLHGTDGEPITSAGAMPTLASELRDILPRRLLRWVPDRHLPPDRARTGPVGYVEGACMLVDRARWEAVGRFDEGYFLFYEEADLSRRFRACGWTSDLVTEVAVTHAIGGSRASVPGAARDHYFTSAVRYLRRWSGGPAALLYSAIAIASWSARGRSRAVPIDEARRARRGVIRAWARHR